VLPLPQILRNFVAAVHWRAAEHDDSFQFASSFALLESVAAGAVCSRTP
jgi:hypothetical protein